ncbi:MAG: hypothetical protein UV73_C0001G0154 [Candidatus Gottesmanbacteria bacterium GW2011_GWA2_43_14]|uniref:Membrane protein 6-pyruvoyl-tetrahydropterin synthase-related domain-containing protein n=1 Tax=Candidatus Gottesmanbacteria bacterium GW2011_GWA2_43_14 TaxID=1618443 RepID=A0A0G1GIQ9_9BACT|nr:MAG: hypothetical protein UV73_C0001G0154 [Candidatus Gottesmanbacteria bacterium GW2011_GWA2_43_14]
MKKTDWLILLFIILTSAYALKDLFLPGFYTSHDGPHQIVRFYYFDRLLREGQFPPRWAGGLNYGFGYPLFIFSYQLPWYIAEIFRSLNFSVIDSVKFTFLAGFILSGITMYWFLRSISGRLAAFTGTILYLYAPYRFSNIFVRAAIGDATAFIFIPMIFLSAVKIRQKKNILLWIALYALSLTGLLLSHAMIFFLVMFAFIPFMLISLRRKKIGRLIIYHLSAFCLFTGLSAYYLLPSFIERSYTKFNAVMGAAFTGNTFVSLKNLLYSPWGYGMMKAAEGGMSLQIGSGQWLALVLAAVFISFKRLRLTLFFTAAFVLSVFMMQKESLFLWESIQELAVIDFTWRILVVSVFSAAVLAALAVNRFKNKKIALILSFMLMVLTFYSNRNHLRVNESLAWDLPFFLALEKTTNSFDEYTPRWVNPELVREKAPDWEYEGEISGKITTDRSAFWQAEVDTSRAGIIRLKKLYYPGWQVEVNGRPADINYRDRGLIEVALPEGESVITARFTSTPLRQFADILSFLSIILTGGLIYYGKKQT